MYVCCLFYVGCSGCVGVCGNMCCEAAAVEDSVLMYFVCLCKGCDGPLLR